MADPFHINICICDSPLPQVSTVLTHERITSRLHDTETYLLTQSLYFGVQKGKPEEMRKKEGVYCSRKDRKTPLVVSPPKGLAYVDFRSVHTSFVYIAQVAACCIQYVPDGYFWEQPIGRDD